MGSLLTIIRFFLQLILFLTMAQMYFWIFLRTGDGHWDTEYAKWRQSKSELHVQVAVKIYLALKPRPETCDAHLGPFDGDNIIGDGGFDIHF
jgi:hypothetical protein